jgi:spore coat polysaccharide biosynthesis predicted glycosyltransferase SpsG
MSSLLGNSEQANLLKDVVAELKQVKSELATLSVISSKAEQHVKKSKDILENVTQGGDTLRTEGV